MNSEFLEDEPPPYNSLVEPLHPPVVVVPVHDPKVVFITVVPKEKTFREKYFPSPEEKMAERLQQIQAKRQQNATNNVDTRIPMGNFQCQRHQGEPLTRASAAAPVVVRFCEDPVLITCPKCETEVTTETELTPGNLCIMYALVIFCVGLAFPLFCLLCWLPFMLDGCKDVDHKCPECKSLIGRYAR